MTPQTVQPGRVVTALGRNAALVMWGLALAGIALRLVLFWINPSANAFDNHFEPIAWILEKGSLAPKDALWQAYQPPVFYVLSALVAKAAMLIGWPTNWIPKLLQFLSCLFGILTLGVVAGILARLPLSARARCLGFGVLCFLPRHIYAGAMHSNDTLASLCVAATVLLALRAREAHFSLRSLLALGSAGAVTLFTKYTSLVALPVLLVAILPALRRDSVVQPLRRIAAVALVWAVPGLLLGASVLSDRARYGELLPANFALYAPAATQPKPAGGLNFWSFKPWQFIQTPILAPWNLDSFWTQLHASMWFDTEPKFLYFVDRLRSAGWWRDQYAPWLVAGRPFPARIELPLEARLVGSSLVALGLVPLLLGALGLGAAVKRTVTRVGQGAWPFFILLLLFNAGGVVVLTLRSPVFSSIKASYFLNSLPAFGAFVGLGAMVCAEFRGGLLRWLEVALGALFVLATLHVLQIAASLEFRLVP